MAWDDSEDDWEAADLSLPQKGEEDKAEWSDEEAHDPDKAEPASAREAEEAARMAALRERAGVSTEIDPSLTGEARERALRKLQQEASDFDNAAAAFGLDMAETSPSEAVRPAPKVGDLGADFVAKSEKDYEKLAESLAERLRPYEGKTGHMSVLKCLLRKAAAGMSTDEAKELSTFASVLYNDKVKADRDKDKKGKKTKGKIKIAMGKDVDNDFGGLEGDGGGGGWRANDDFDFM
ncbi:hypothetical protein EMIHUDRAFT_254760 [Emiliania huxleyi CCMP1516]|uniref:Eukaryotic translation initiation factor 3 30 kDa subunit n=2 Tax=Emiliania huxleyi TaxID=2903 RepID=A0A0D3JLT5_EMIH1|nr:hypothetical protein EMIHUDRAFT_254760 [Emiliania huxleyi CCMP1516]EOD24470.1 hypothetical protein EMIHUDRAFT_254760 [Emiliania huxleyi CCMP1516]|eukprot:XP_005776899.1 hypothetical protein EMIHUDRAFT_254760 [Emiliania huxleyi CCMP1516]